MEDIFVSKMYIFCDKKKMFPLKLEIQCPTSFPLFTNVNARSNEKVTLILPMLGAHYLT